MPYKNVIKHFIAGGWYHIYNRTHTGNLFYDQEDYEYFYTLLSRYLGDVKIDVYPNFSKQVSIACYCLMSNHFHFLVLLKETDGIKELMRSLMTSYVKYFHKKYHKRGPLFESNYKSSRIDNDVYLKYVVRYILRNPSDWETNVRTSFSAMFKPCDYSWLHTNDIEEYFESKQQFMDFMKDKKEYKDFETLLLPILANR